ncbi:hypothetical protein INT47_005001 [Mucor saturninus]|uniref:F-box domain-containing protein n=1 Tax=Mucor saturninus TaxID=64648 RepID=A0A8H7QKK8_9FUNG|nr:hypothetical protein INT47_005001 [Mucor saturninus]
MKNMDEGWGDFTFEEQHEARFLSLPNSVMEHICRYLENLSDKYNACLIHRQWTTAAQNVLWERIRFKTPINFRRFLISVQENKKTALLVRDLYLAFADHEKTLFEPIVRSTLERHSVESVLSKPLHIARMIKSCENLKSLTVYGRNLDSAFIDILASTAQDLTSLYIISTRPTHQLAFNNLLSRLTSLRLDGDFSLDARWAVSLANRATHLTELQLSLKSINVDVLQKISAPGKLALTSLIFTDAAMMIDNYVMNVLAAFPRLTRFCLEGSVRVTALSILYALKQCPDLNSIEMRAHPDSLNYELDGSSLSTFNSSVYNNSSALPCRLLVENMNLDCNQLLTLSPYLSLVQTVGFKNCPQLTTTAIEQCFNKNKFIHIFQSINCPNIGSDILRAFSTIANIAKSLYRVHLGSSGPVDPKDIYQLCCSSSSHNLRQIRLVDYDDIQQTVIGNYNEALPNNQDFPGLSVITLNRRSIDAISHTTDPELCPPPEDRLVNGSTLVRLAEHFKMDLADFMDLLDSFEEESETAMKSVSRPKGITFDSSANYALGDKPSNRVFALKGQASNMRPTTPALWSQDLEHNDVNENYEESGSDETNSNGNEEEDQTDDSRDDSRDESRDVTEEDEEEYETLSHLTNTDSNKWASNPAVSNTGSEIKTTLGGWGSSTTEPWDPNPKNHHHITAVRTPSPPVVQEQRKSRTHVWAGFTAEKYNDEWQQNSLTVNNTKVTPKRSTNHYRNSPAVAESDGWGSTDKYVPWHNVKEQGFVAEVIEEQKKTSYWNGEEYINLNSSNGPSNDYDNDTTVVGSSGNTTPGSPPMLFSDLANNINTSSTRNPISKVDNRKNIPRPRSESLVSSDGSVSWNDVSVTPAIKVSTNKATQKFSVDKKPKAVNPVRSRWMANEEDWNNLKNSLPESTQNSTPTQTPSKGSWQDSFSPEVIADQTATNKWSSLTANASVRPKFSRPARKGRDSIPPANMPGNWGELSNSPSSRATTVSPSQNVKPSSSAVLVDTDNIPETSSGPTLKGDVWESIGTLDIMPSRPSTASHVLIPQEVPLTKRASAEVFDWSNHEVLPKEPLVQDKAEPLLHFVNTVPGTITDTEIKMQEQQQSNDNLVDFEESIPSFPYPQPVSTPPISVGIDSPGVLSANIPQPQEEKNTLPKITTPEIPAELIMNESSLTDITSHIETTTPAPSSPQPPPKNEIDDSSITEKKRKPFKMKILVGKEMKSLAVQDDEDIDEVVTKFCVENNIMDQFAGIAKRVQEKRTIKQTKDIFTPPGKKIKKKSLFPQ